MATFTYIARTRTGEKVEGSIEADDRRGALRQIQQLGHVPVSVKEGKAAKPEQAPVKRFMMWHGRTDRMRTRELLVFTTELSDLLASGMTLGTALNSLANRKSGRAGDSIVAGLRDDIVQGASLSEAMSNYPKTFSQLYVSMIRAGEAGGALHEVLSRLVEHYERIQEIKEKIIMALVYPSIVIVMGVGVLAFSMVYVVPKFEAVFDQLGGALPLPTQILISVSRGLAKYGWAVLIGLGIGSVLANRAVKTKAGQLWWHGTLLKLPLIRGIVASGIFANFARTLGTLLKNGVPVLQALGIVEKTVGNAVVAREIGNARERVTDGTTISGPFAAGKVMPPLMIDMLAVGEQTGDMTGALSHIARRYENELDRNVKIFTTALEPMMIVVVAVLVGFVAISILMAVFNLTSGLNV